MKKAAKLLIVLVAVLLIGTAFGARDVSAAADDELMKKYFPNGIEKIKPIKPTIDTRDASFIGAIITQSDEFLALARDCGAGTEEVDTGDNALAEFEYKYGINGLDAGVQFDISVDGGDWQYDKSWDTFEHDAYADGFCFYEYTGGQFSDNNLVFSLMIAASASEGKLLKKTLKNDEFDLTNHSFKVRYRFFLQYGYIDDYDAGIQYRFTDWSDATSFGKSDEVAAVDDPTDEIPAPDISNPIREPDDNGVLDGSSAIGQVQKLKAKTTKTTSIKLSWSKVEGAEFYEIYSGSNKLLGTTKTNSFTVKNLKSGTGYDFKVRAVADKVLAGLFSDTLQTPTKPAKVKISSAKLAKEKLTVKYKKAAGSGYEIQIATDKKFKNDLVKLTVEGAAKLKAVQKELTGKTYYVRVRAYITYGGKTVYGKWSKVKGAKKK